jgi:hypothetical protein
MTIRSLFLLLVLSCPGLLRAQEMKFIDISNVRQRTELRYPPAPECKSGMLCGGYGGGSVEDGIYLLRVAPTDINPAEPFQVEFKILNTGTAPIEIPVSPHLSDLQPNDESKAFSYFSVALVVWGRGRDANPICRLLWFC